MITVKFFGLLSVDANVRQLQVPPGTIKEVFHAIEQSERNLSQQQLEQAVLFVNKKQVSGNKRFSLMLQSGDELVLLSPTSGG